MATNKTLNTRVQLKYDLYANWTSANPVLLKGEIAVVEVPANIASVNNAPTILFKVGDGTTSFNSLGWASATAADVYTWAKEANLTVQTEGTGNVVAGVVWEASLNGGKGGLKVTTASVATSEGLETLQRTVATINADYLKAADKTELQNAIDLKLAKTDFETFKTDNTAAIADAKKAGTDAADALTTYKTLNDAAVEAAKSQADANKAAIDKLNGDATTEGSVDKKIADLDLVNTYEAKGAAATAEANAIAHADELNTDMDGRVADLEAMFGDGEGTVEAQIEAAIAAEVTARDAAIKVETDRATAAERTLTDDLAAEVARAKAAEEANATAIAGVKEDVDAFFADANLSESAKDTLKEIQDYIDSDASAAAEMTASIQANKQAIEAEVTRATGIEAGLETRLAVVEAYDHAADVQAAKDYADGLNTAMDTRVKDLENHKNDYIDYADQAETDAKAYADSLADNYATAAQGTLADSALQSVSVLGHDLTKGSNTLTVDQAKTALGLGSAAYVDTTAFDAAGAANQALTDAKAHVAEREAVITAEVAKKVDKVEGSSLVPDTEITKLATVEESAEKNIIEIVKVNGVALEVNATDRSVDISHNVDDLEQDANTYVILNCGSATEII